MLPLQHNHSMNMQLMAEFSHPRPAAAGVGEGQSRDLEELGEQISGNRKLIRTREYADIDGEGKNAARAAALHHVMGSGGMLADRSDRSRANFTDPVAG